jgi:hypothetical protein
MPFPSRVPGVTSSLKNAAEDKAAAIAEVDL